MRRGGGVSRGQATGNVITTVLSSSFGHVGELFTSFIRTLLLTTAEEEGHIHFFRCSHDGFSSFYKLERSHTHCGHHQ